MRRRGCSKFGRRDNYRHLGGHQGPDVGTKLKNVCSRIEWDLSWEICVLCYVQSRRSPAFINTCQMLDSPHTSAPMLMRGNTSPTTRSPPHRSQSPKSIGKATGTSRQSQRTPDTTVGSASKRQKVRDFQPQVIADESTASTNEFKTPTVSNTRSPRY
jgi:hypothetical protein